jgi:hypothetical protein
VGDSGLSYLDTFVLLLIAIVAVIAASIGYARFIVRLFSTAGVGANIGRFATYSALSLIAGILHTLFRCSSTEFREYFSPAGAVALIFLLFILGLFGITNAAILGARKMGLPSETQVCLGIASLLVGGAGLGAMLGLSG